MKRGKAFELLVKTILLHLGFLKVSSDGLYIFDGTAGQMIQGLGDAHNADVLLEPIVQTPFYAPSRLLIECKDQKEPVGLGVLRGVLGLREDINNFDIVDAKELIDRRNNRRRGLTYDYERIFYQVAVASMSRFTVPAQNFAATHRIPLIEFNKMPFWEIFIAALGNNEEYDDDWGRVSKIADAIAERSALAVTNSGQLLFLYMSEGKEVKFKDYYSLHWSTTNEPWTLRSGDTKYVFQLPDTILKAWLDNSITDFDIKSQAINCKERFMSNMIVYYTELNIPKVKMISINREMLTSALNALKGDKQEENKMQ